MEGHCSTVTAQGFSNLKITSYSEQSINSGLGWSLGEMLVIAKCATCAYDTV